MVFAAAGLSSLHGNDFCTANRANAADNRVALWPPGRECTVARANGSTESEDAGGALGFAAVLAAGLLLVGIRRSRLAVATAAVFGVTGLTALGVPIAPAFGFGWVFGGILAYRFTRSVPATLIAAAALAVGGVLELAGAGAAGWAIVLLALLWVPGPEDAS